MEAAARGGCRAFLAVRFQTQALGISCQVYKNSVHGLFIKPLKKKNQSAKANAPSKALCSNTDIAIVPMFHREADNNILST